MTAHRVHTSSKTDATFTRPPMGEAMRQHIHGRLSPSRRNEDHGPLVPMDEPPLNRWIIICPPLAVGLFLATVEILR
jgi:hypothetical protein